MTTTITIGPYHPYLLEPSVVDLQVQDGTITDSTVTVGFVNRAVEALMETKTYRQNVYLAERICGICSNVHTLAFCQATEEILGIEVPPQARRIRTIFVELERLHSHYLCLALLAHALHEGERFGAIMREREALIALLERLSGNRIHYSINTIGGVRREVDGGAIRACLPGFQRLSESVLEALDARGPLGEKIAGVGVVDGDEALRLGAVGPTLRGSGVASDVRREDGYAAYGELEFDVIVEPAGDTRARFLVRAKETLESLRILRQLLERLGEGPILGDLKEPNLKERREVLGRAEAPRGELVYFLDSNGTTVPGRVKIRTPTFANLRFLQRALAGERVEHARPIIESIDPCLSCTDR
ncbi:MAG: nickel-dependent hydrogenase large subunit [Candidatus Methylomirabilota bacterium]